MGANFAALTAFKEERKEEKWQSQSNFKSIGQ